jgi:hypothetical protein
MGPGKWWGQKEEETNNGVMEPMHVINKEKVVKIRKAKK